MLPNITNCTAESDGTSRTINHQNCITGRCTVGITTAYQFEVAIGGIVVTDDRIAVAIQLNRVIFANITNTIDLIDHIATSTGRVATTCHT